jgi:hypothetical protein
MFPGAASMAEVAGFAASLSSSDGSVLSVTALLSSANVVVGAGAASTGLGVRLSMSLVLKVCVSSDFQPVTSWPALHDDEGP